VVTGRIERGKVKVGEEVESCGFRETPQDRCQRAWKCSRSRLERRHGGDNAGLLLRSIAKEDVERGMVLAKGGSITPHTKFKAEIYVLNRGRRRAAHAVLQGLSSAVLLPAPPT